MNNFPGWFDQALSVFSAANLQLLLLVGSGILAVALLVLAMTRWGHSRPVWKCVILSCVAHVLLLGYAYGTRLIFGTPQVAVEEAEPLRVNLIEEDGDSPDGEDEATAATESWNQFVAQQPTPSVSDDLERPEFDSEVIIENTIDRTASAPVSSSSEPSMETPEQSIEQPQLTRSTPDPNTEFEPTESSVAMQTAELQRRKQSTPSNPEPMLDSATELSRQEIKHELESPDATHQATDAQAQDRITRPSTKDWVKANSNLPVAPDSLPQPTRDAGLDNIRPLRALPPKSSLRTVSSPRRIGDGQPLPTVYSLRNADNRLTIARQRGGSIETERAVELALRWLAENQEEDGSWSSRKSGGGREDKIFGHNRNGAGSQADCGVSALALLAFLASGQSHLEGQYQAEIQRGLEFLVRSQRSNGDLSGNAKLFAKMYCHSMSLLALSEALAMTGDRRLLNSVKQGVNYTVGAQNRRDGGWRYAPGDPGDMSQFGWQVLALHSARLGNVAVPEATFSRMEMFLDSCTSGAGKGLASYRPRQAPNTTMTAEALLCRFFLRQSVGPITLSEASRQISSDRPSPRNVNLYYWYYGTLAMYHAGGSDWEQWNSDLKRTLLQLQVRDGQDTGSWPANGVWGGYGGEVYSTAMATLSLEVYYRYLPIYQEIANSNSSPGINQR